MSGRRSKLKRQQKPEGPLLSSWPSLMSAPDRAPHKDIAGILAQGTETHIEHSGPLPPPEMLREYEKIIPRAAERFLALVEKEQDNRNKIEQRLTEALVQDTERARQADKRGDLIAVYIFTACMLSGFAVLYFGYPTALAATLMGAPLVTSVATFLFKRRQARDSKSQSPRPK